MKLKSLLSLTVLTLLTSACIGQNELLIMKPGDSIPGVLSITDSDVYYERYNYRVAAPPMQLVKEIPLTVNYTKAASFVLNSFQSDPLGDYGRANPGDAIFGWLQSGFGGAVKPENDKTPVKESIKKVLCTNRQVRDMIYAWMMPYFQKAFSIMSAPEQQGYLAALNAAKEFATNLDIEKERKVAKKAADYAGDVGHLHAFIYRRVANKELTKEECLEWLNRIVADLSVAKNNNPEAEDNYVLRTDQGYGYYTASVYNAWDNYGETYVIKKQDGKYSLVPGVSFDAVHKCGENLLIGLRSNYPDPASYGYLYYDSLGSFYKETPDELPFSGIALKGTGRTGRALLFYTPDYYEVVEFDSTIGDAVGRMKTIGVCCVIDIDSGYVIQDSMYIPCVEKKINDWGDVECTYPSADGNYVIFSNGAYGLYGMIGPNGNVVLEPEYETIEATDDPAIFELNGEENFDVRTGMKTKIK